MVFNCTERGGFPAFACIWTLYLRVSLIILNESSRWIFLHDLYSFA